MLGLFIRRRLLWISQLLGDSFHWLLERRPIRAIVRVITAPWRALIGVIDHWRALEDKPQKRRISDAILGLPFLAFLIGVVSLAFVAQTRQERLGQTLFRQGLAASAKGDFAAAEMLLSRAQRLEGVDAGQAGLQLVKVWQTTGNDIRARNLLRELAPTDRVGVPGAHTQQALTLASNQALRESREIQDQLSWHLDHADKSQPGRTEIARAYYHLAREELKEAAASYSRAAQYVPEALVPLGRLYIAMEDRDNAMKTFQEAVGRFQEILAKNPKSLETRLLLAQSLVAQDQVVEAISILDSAPENQSNSILPRLIGELHVRLFDDATKANQDLAVSLRHLSDALDRDPNHRLAIERLISVALVSKESVPKTLDLLQSALAIGKVDPAILHLALSLVTHLSEKKDESLFHLERALSLDGASPIIANNLAWLLAMEEEPDLDRSQLLIDAVVEKYPDNGHFLDTRSLVLFRKGELKMALADLELAILKLEKKQVAQARMAVIYEKLGMTSLAKRYSEEAGLELVEAQRALVIDP